MKTNNIGLVILIRVLIGVAICPYVVALLTISPAYFASSNSNFFVPVYLYITTFLSYTVAIIFGLPLTLYLAIKNKCNYKTFAITGFTLGAITCIIFLLKLELDKNSYPHTINDISLIISYSLWYGFCAAIGAILFGFISSLPKWYNKSINRT